MYVTTIVLAAGRGERFKSKISKPLIKINSKPIIINSLLTLSNHPFIKDIIVVANSSNKKGIINKIKEFHIKKIKDIILGGIRRSDSVINGLKAMDAHTDLVLIHDGVRPFINKKIISCVIKEAKKFGAAVVGVPVKATIKKIKNQKSKIKIVEKTMDRSDLWEIQTPQVFKKELILKAYKKFKNIAVTDDASLVERLAHPVRVIRGSYFNIKITTPDDLIIARAIVKSL